MGCMRPTLRLVEAGNGCSSRAAAGVIRAEAGSDATIRLPQSCRGRCAGIRDSHACAPPGPLRRAQPGRPAVSGRRRGFSMHRENREGHQPSRKRCPERLQGSGSGRHHRRTLFAWEARPEPRNPRPGTPQGKPARAALARGLALRGSRFRYGRGARSADRPETCQREALPRSKSESHRA